MDHHVCSRVFIEPTSDKSHSSFISLFLQSGVKGLENQEASYVDETND